VTLLDMVRALSEAGVRFVMIGGLAMRAQGSTRVTEDLDICYDPAPENVRRLATALADWHAYLRGVEPGLPFVMDERAFRTNPVMTLVTDRGAIDVMDEVAGVGGWEAVLAASEETTWSGTQVRVLSLVGLIKAKRAAGRPKDLAQLPELEALLQLRRRTGGRSQA
jgi:predicted nucleotidyltransferase